MRLPNPIEYLTNPRRRRRVFYATQFGAYWALTEDQLQEVLKLGIRGEAYNLDAPGVARRIKHKPKVYSTVFNFLDWERGAFAITLRELDAGEKSFLHQTWIWGA